MEKRCIKQYGYSFIRVAHEDVEIIIPVAGELFNIVT